MTSACLMGKQKKRSRNWAFRWWFCPGFRARIKPAFWMTMSEAPIKPQVLDDPPMPLTEHLVELRRRLIVSLLILAAGSAAVFHFSGEFLNWLARPVGSLIFVGPTEAFYTRLRLAVYGGFFLAPPPVL